MAWHHGKCNSLRKTYNMQASGIQEDAGVEYRVTMIINAEHCFKSKSLPFAQRITCPLNRLHLQSGVCAKLCKTVRLKWRREIVS